MFILLHLLYPSPLASSFHSVSSSSLFYLVPSRSFFLCVIFSPVSYLCGSSLPFFPFLLSFSFPYPPLGNDFTFIPLTLVHLSIVIQHYSLAASGSGEQTASPSDSYTLSLIVLVRSGGVCPSRLSISDHLTASSHVSTDAHIHVLFNVVVRSPITSSQLLPTSSGKARAQLLPHTPPCLQPACESPWV